MQERVAAGKLKRLGHTAGKEVFSRTALRSRPSEVAQLLVMGDCGGFLPRKQR